MTVIYIVISIVNILSKCCILILAESQLNATANRRRELPCVLGQCWIQTVASSNTRTSFAESIVARDGAE